MPETVPSSGAGVTPGQPAHATGEDRGGPDITVAICTCQRYDLLRLAVESCLDQTLPAGRYRVLIVDNAPDPARAEAEKARYGGEPVTYLIEKTPGVSNARNLAARTCGTPFIAYLDDDARASPHWLESIRAAFEVPGARVGVVGGRVEPRWEVPPPPWLHRDLLGYLSVVDWGGAAPRLASRGEWFAGTNQAFRTELIAAAGYFNTRLGRVGGEAALLGNEELEIDFLIEAAGYARVYAPTACVSHFVPAARLTQAWFRKRVAWQAVSDLMTNPKVRATRPPSLAWKLVAGFLGGLPPARRSPASFFRATNDPVLFRHQLAALYGHTLLALQGVEFVDSPGFLEAARVAPAGAAPPAAGGGYAGA